MVVCCIDFDGIPVFLAADRAPDGGAADMIPAYVLSVQAAFLAVLGALAPADVFFGKIRPAVECSGYT